MHKETTILIDSSESLVVFIHGFMGSPEQFHDLMQIAKRNRFSCISILLPGHGASWKEFVSHGFESWTTHVKTTIEYYGHNYKYIYLVGHSMGGLLALNASLQITIADKIHSVFLIAPPMKTNIFNLKSVYTKIKFLLYPKNHEIKSAYQNANSICGGPMFARLQFIKPIFQFYRLMHHTRNELNEVLVPATLIFSKNDETVSLKSINIFKAGLVNSPHTILVLTHSQHAYYAPEEWGIILREFSAYLKTHKAAYNPR